MKMNEPLPDSPDGQPRTARRTVRPVFRWAERMFAVLGLMMFVYHTCFELAAITSGSMEPTLRGTGPHDGDRVLVERISYTLRGPRRWEVAALWNQQGTPVMKRIVGLPGEDVSIVNRKIHIDSEEAPGPAGLGLPSSFAHGQLQTGLTMATGDGYFALGDNSRDSQDSRFEGPFAESALRGRALAIVWPPSRTRLLAGQ